jgi:hypothetical protein
MRASELVATADPKLARNVSSAVDDTGAVWFPFRARPNAPPMPCTAAPASPQRQPMSPLSTLPLALMRALLMPKVVPPMKRPSSRSRGLPVRHPADSLCHHAGITACVVAPLPTPRDAFAARTRIFSLWPCTADEPVCLTLPASPMQANWRRTRPAARVPCIFSRFNLQLVGGALAARSVKHCAQPTCCFTSAKLRPDTAWGGCKDMASKPGGGGAAAESKLRFQSKSTPSSVPLASLVKQASSSGGKKVSCGPAPGPSTMLSYQQPHEICNVGLRCSDAARNGLNGPVCSLVKGIRQNGWIDARARELSEYARLHSCVHSTPHPSAIISQR